MSSFHAIVRAAYAPHEAEDAWLSGIVRATHECFGTDVGAYVVENELRPRLGSYCGVGETYLRWMDHASRVHGKTPVATLRLLHAGGPFTSLWSERSALLRAQVGSEAEGFVSEVDTIVASMESDTVGLYGGSARGGVMLCAAYTGTRLAPRTRSALRRVAVHLEAAYRLRRVRHVEPDALLDESGAILERLVPLDEREVAAGVRRVSAAASLASHDDERAIEVWRGLVAGRWSLVQAREHGRRRVLLLRRNELPEASGDDATARRQSSVMALAARGHSNKLIAYELGVPMSTVASDLRTVLTRLGLARRTDLVRMSLAMLADAD